MQTKDKECLAARPSAIAMIARVPYNAVRRPAMNPIMDRDHRMRTAPSIPHQEIIWKTGTRASLGVLVFPPLGLGSPKRHAILVPHKMLANTILPELEVHDFTRHFSLKKDADGPQYSSS